MKTLSIIKHSNGTYSVASEGISVGSSIDDVPQATSVEVDDGIYQRFLDNPADLTIVKKPDGSVTIGMVQ